MQLTKTLVLASASPRRRQILSDAGYEFAVRSVNTDESYPGDLDPRSIAAYLARKKADAIAEKGADEIVLTADTVVIRGDVFLGKPADADEAGEMLRMLSGGAHKVITGIAFSVDGRVEVFDDTTEVYFKKLDEWEIDHYIKKYKPYDKAGAYGIQEWIGMIGIEKIVGSYFNVVGLPIHAVHSFLRRYVKLS